MLGLLLSLSLPGLAQAAPGTSVGRILPAKTRGLLAIDIAALRQGGYWQGLGSLVKGQEAFREAEKALARVDPKLLDQLTSVVIAFPNGFDVAGEFILIIEGEGLLSAVASLLTKHAGPAVARTHRGAQYQCADSICTGALAGNVIVAPEPLYRQVLDVHHKRSPSLFSDADFRQLAASIDTGADVWLSFDTGARPVFSGAAPKLQSLAASATLKRGLALQASARFATAAEVGGLIVEAEKRRAETAADTMVVTMGLDSLIKKARLSQDGKLLNLGLRISHKELLRLAPMWDLAKTL